MDNGGEIFRTGVLNQHQDLVHGSRWPQNVPRNESPQIISERTTNSKSETCDDMIISVLPVHMYLLLFVTARYKVHTV